MAQSPNQKKYQKHRYAEVLDAMGITDSVERQRIYTRLYTHGGNILLNVEILGQNATL